MGIVKLPGDRYRLQVRRKGFPTVDKVFQTLEEAQAAHDSALARAQDPLDTADDMTIAQAWAKYQQSTEFEDKAPRTQGTEKGRIMPILERLGGYSLARLAANPRIVWQYVDDRKKDVSPRTRKKLSSTSIRLELAALSSVAAWAVKRQILMKNFVKDIQRPTQVKRKRRVPHIEQGAIELATRKEDVPMLAQAARFQLLLRYLGCRPGELSMMRRTDISFANKSATFRDTKYKGEDRLVHVTNPAIHLLNAQYAFALENAPDSKYLFSTQGRDNAWKPYNYAWGVTLLKEAGIVGKDFHPHAMRREYISRAIEGGIPYSTIRKQTGHHSTQAIEIYDEGLSTAPEIRKALDEHSKNVTMEMFVGLMLRQGLTMEQIEQFTAEMKGEKEKVKVFTFANGEQVKI